MIAHRRFLQAFIFLSVAVLAIAQDDIQEEPPAGEDPVDTGVDVDDVGEDSYKSVKGTAKKAWQNFKPSLAHWSNIGDFEAAATVPRWERQFLADVDPNHFASGDVPVDGACASEVKEYCATEEARKAIFADGEDKPRALGDKIFTAPVAKCLRRKMIRERVSIDSAAPSISPPCRREVRAYFAHRAMDLRRDPSLVNACRAELGSHCAGIAPGSGAVLACLKSHKDDLTSKCATAVTVRQADSAEDITLDGPLRLACSADRDRLCSEIGFGGGKAKACLGEKMKELSSDCQREIFRRDVEDAEDVRFNKVLTEACAADKVRFCTSVEPGRARVLGCLEDNKDHLEFTDPCKNELLKYMARRSTDWRLDYRLRSLCWAEVEEQCSDIIKQDTGASIYAPFELSGSVLECLKDKRSNIKDKSCQDYVTTLAIADASDRGVDVPLLLSCEFDVRAKCANTSLTDGAEGGVGGLQHCLRQHQDTLEEGCKKKLLQRQIWGAFDYRLKPGMARLCARERLRFCAGLQPGKGDVVRCLQDHRLENGFGPVCKRLVEEDLAEAAADVRLQSSVQNGCGEDLQRICGHVKPGKGKVLHCLMANSTQVRAPACREAVMRLIFQSADNWKHNAVLRSACSNDVSAYCRTVKPGAGSVHRCLRTHWHDLSVTCRNAQEFLESKESEDIRLEPRLRVACREAQSKYCMGIEPGNARVISCLQSHLSDDGFPHGCGEEMSKLISMTSEKLSLQKRLVSACSNEFVNRCGIPLNDTYLNAIKHGSQEEETGMACLLSLRHDAYDKDGIHDVSWDMDVSQTCRNELSRVTRVHFRLYRLESRFTEQCDEDSVKFCGVERRLDTAPFAESGQVHACLARKGPDVSHECWTTLMFASGDVDSKVLAEHDDVENAAAMALAGIDNSAEHAEDMLDSVIEMAQPYTYTYGDDMNLPAGSPPKRVTGLHVSGFRGVVFFLLIVVSTAIGSCVVAAYFRNSIMRAMSAVGVDTGAVAAPGGRGKKGIVYVDKD